MIFVNLGILSNHCFGEFPVRIGFGLDIAQVLTKGFMAGHSKGVRSLETKRHAEHLYDAIRLGEGPLSWWDANQWLLVGQVISHFLILMPHLSQ